MRRLSLACVLIIVGILSAKAAVYRWVDAQGKVHYSDKPVAGAKQMSIQTAPTNPDAVDAREKARQDALDAYSEQKKEADKAQSEADKKAAARADACKKAKEHLTELEQARRVTKTDKDGNKTYLDADQISAARADAQAEVSKLCNG